MKLALEYRHTVAESMAAGVWFRKCLRLHDNEPLVKAYLSRKSYSVGSCSYVERIVEPAQASDFVCKMSSSASISIRELELSDRRPWPVDWMWFRFSSSTRTSTKAVSGSIGRPVVSCVVSSDAASWRLCSRFSFLLQSLKDCFPVAVFASVCVWLVGCLPDCFSNLCRIVHIRGLTACVLALACVDLFAWQMQVCSGARCGWVGGPSSDCVRGTCKCQVRVAHLSAEGMPRADWG